MILDITLGSADLARSTEFYDPVMAALGIARNPNPDPPSWVGWGDQPPLWLVSPYDKRPPTAGNGTMVTFKANSEAQVQAFHQAALANGGSDEGPPGIRPYYDPTFYVAYVRDPDGNKLAAVFERPKP